MLAIVVVFFARGDPEPGRPAAGPASSDQRGLQACGAGDLVAGRIQRRASGGTAYLTATLELARGVEPCWVGGFPVVVVLSDRRPAGVATVTDDRLGDTQQLTVLPDRSAKITFSWAASHYCGPVVNDALRIWVAPDAPVEVPGFGASSCSPGDGRPPVQVGPFTDVDPDVERGTVAGVVTLNSGPAPGTGEYVTAGVVEFAGDPDDFVAAIQADGSYEIELPAGRYEVTVTTHQFSGGAAHEAGLFDVTGGERNDLSVTLPVR